MTTTELAAAVARLRSWFALCPDMQAREDIATVLSALESAQQDARRLEWFFSDTEKGAWINEYLRGVHDHWTMDQWRAAIDAAMGEGDA